jgi:hypothetical protein
MHASSAVLGDLLLAARQVCLSFLANSFAKEADDGYGRSGEPDVPAAALRRIGGKHFKEVEDE